ncbi:MULTISPECIES: biotin transporter BioY [Enterococcus]|uniref:Biotin transporter n=2 Tax=Candidatus Enterococcus ferrettii TaxID=2815324 RepID=A0ABV0EJ66_9ENTE|nr:biotin transporter BioY [Enterococcus sp. 665A]MBO1339178.1 biotin transporter BioY [Enterococcus sp. 665A]
MKLSSREMVLAGMFAAAIGVLSQFTIPFGPIPLTLQTFAVGFVVTILGKKTGTLAILIYLLMGFIGLPVFAGGSAGIGVVFGPTGGFLVGFIFNGLITGWMIEKTSSNYFWSILANILGAFVTLFFGALWLKFGASMSWPSAFSVGMIPFLIPGLIKAVAAGYLGHLISQRLPRSFSYSK